MRAFFKGDSKNFLLCLEIHIFWGQVSNFSTLWFNEGQKALIWLLHLWKCWAATQQLGPCITFIAHHTAMAPNLNSHLWKASSSTSVNPSKAIQDARFSQCSMNNNKKQHKLCVLMMWSCFWFLHSNSECNHSPCCPITLWHQALLKHFLPFQGADWKMRFFVEYVHRRQRHGQMSYANQWLIRSSRRSH